MLLVAGMAWAALRKERMERITEWIGAGMENEKCANCNEPLPQRKENGAIKRSKILLQM